MQFFPIQRRERCMISSAWPHLIRLRAGLVPAVIKVQEADSPVSEQEAERSSTVRPMAAPPIILPVIWATWEICSRTCSEAAFIRVDRSIPHGQEREADSQALAEVMQEMASVVRTLRMRFVRRERAASTARRAQMHRQGLLRQRPAIGPQRFTCRSSRHALAEKHRSTPEAAVLW